MAILIRESPVLIPAGTPASSPMFFDISFPPMEVDRIEIRVPPGPRGNVGFQLGSGGLSIIPDNAPAYIVTDDEVIGWDLADLIDSGAWQLIGYNTGIYDHTIYVRFLLDIAGATTSSTPPVISAGALSGSVPPVVPGAPPAVVPPVVPTPPVITPPATPAPPPLPLPTLPAPPVLLPPGTAPIASQGPAPTGARYLAVVTSLGP